MLSFLVTVFFVCLLHFNGAKRSNVVVTLHRKDVYSLFSEGEIWGIQFQNKTADIVEAEVVIEESKISEILETGAVISYKIIYDDADETIRQEMSRINNRTKWNPKMKPDIFFQEYRDWPEQELFMDALLIRFPTLTSQSIIGQTIQGRDIKMITVSTGGGDKPGFYIGSELHAREWLANAATMWILNNLCEEYGNDAEITTLLDAINFYIVPTINVDGYIYAWTTDRNWRKNRRNNGGGTFGVDLNRNYDVPPLATFCGDGASSNPGSNTYCGTSAFSEPETAATGEVMMNPSYNIGAALDVHTSGTLILWPWSYTYNPAPDYDALFALGEAQEEAIRDVNGVTYESIQSSQLYPATGAMSDYAYATADAMAFVYEGRGPGFNPSPTLIIPAGEEQLAGVLTIAQTL